MAKSQHRIIGISQVSRAVPLAGKHNQEIPEGDVPALVPGNKPGMELAARVHERERGLTMEAQGWGASTIRE